MISQPVLYMRDKIPLELGEGSTLQLQTAGEIRLTSDSWFAVKTNGQTIGPDKVEKRYELTLVEGYVHSVWEVTSGEAHADVSPIMDGKFVKVMVGHSDMSMTTYLVILWIILLFVWVIIIDVLLMQKEKKVKM